MTVSPLDNIFMVHTPVFVFQHLSEIRACGEEIQLIIN